MAAWLVNESWRRIGESVVVRELESKVEKMDLTDDMEIENDDGKEENMVLATDDTETGDCPEPAMSDMAKLVASLLNIKSRLADSYARVESVLADNPPGTTVYCPMDTDSDCEDDSLVSYDEQDNTLATINNQSDSSGLKEEQKLGTQEEEPSTVEETPPTKAGARKRRRRLRTSSQVTRVMKCSLDEYYCSCGNYIPWYGGGGQLLPELCCSSLADQQQTLSPTPDNKKSRRLKKYPLVGGAKRPRILDTDLEASLNDRVQEAANNICSRFETQVELNNPDTCSAGQQTMSQGNKQSIAAHSTAVLKGIITQSKLNFLDLQKISTN